MNSGEEFVGYTLIVSPLIPEYDAVRASLALRGHRERTAKLGALSFSVFASARIICAVGGLGKAQFGIQTQFFLNRLAGITRVYCVGSAGSLASDVRVFDVVVADATVEHDFLVRFVDRPQPCFAGSQVLLAELREVACLGFSTHFGTVASGDEDIVCVRRGAEVALKTGAIAVAWEGAGGARAAALQGLPFAEVRGVTDLVGTRAIDFRANIRIACMNATNLVYDSMPE